MKRTRSAGFTLIELTVALLAGLIVGMGVVGLSRDATRTFHEEIRGAAAEASLRTAVDRLRADLERAGYMSTSNMVMDPMIAKAPGALTTANIVDNTLKGLYRLSSVYRVPGGSATSNALSLSGPNGVAPDMIEIGGNMTGTDQFQIQSTGTAGSGSCTRINLVGNSPAMYRVLNTGNSAPQVLADLFRPVPSSDTTTQFMVRLVDETGRTQFLVTCAEAAEAGFAVATAPFNSASGPYVDIDTTRTPIVTPAMTGGNGGWNGKSAGIALLNPVQIVRWEIAKPSTGGTDQEPAQYQSLLAGTSLDPAAVDQNKYDLMRSYVDAFDNIVPSTSEIVAEYAVDLSFAFSVDTGTSSTTPNIVTYGFDDAANNDLWAQNVFINPSLTGPQHIRSIRFRLVTRTAQPDRTVNIPVANFGSQKFLYRYVLDPTDAKPFQFARARTLTTEVSLPNQMTDFY